MLLISVCIISCLAESPIYQLIYFSVETLPSWKVTLALEYVENLKWRQAVGMYKTANEVVKKEWGWNKWYYDQKIRCGQWKVGE